MRTRNLSQPSRSSECSLFRTLTRSTCSKMTTLSCSFRDHKVSSFPHFIPSVAQFSVRENMLYLSGAAETKELKDLMPGILKQVGPKQYQFLKSQLVDQAQGKEEDDDDDVPNLVGNFDGTQ